MPRSTKSTRKKKPTAPGVLYAHARSGNEFYDGGEFCFTKIDHVVETDEPTPVAIYELKEIRTFKIVAELVEVTEEA